MSLGNFARAACIGFIATAATAETIVVSPCQSETSTVTAAEMGKYLEGTWQMSAPGTGFTTGTNTGAVTLRFDAVSGFLKMEADGTSVPLNPIDLAWNLDGPAPEAPDFDMDITGLSAAGLTAQEIELLTDCARPMRYWWTMGSGSRKSWGGLMFVEHGLGSGFMANSAGGSRSVMLSR